VRVPDRRREASPRDVPELPVVLASSGVCIGCGAAIPPDGPNGPVGMTREQLISSGRTKCLCPSCGMPIRRWKLGRKSAPTCICCGRPVPEADPATVRVTCGLCTSHRADLQRLGLLRRTKPERTCPDCGGERPKYAKRCRRCAARRRRQAARERQRRRRAKRGAEVSRFSEILPFAEKDLQATSDRRRPGGQPLVFAAEKRDRRPSAKAAPKPWPKEEGCVRPHHD